MGSVRIAAVIAANQLHRFSLDRSNVFWLVALPLGIVLVLGASLTPLMGGSFEPTRPYDVAVATGSAPTAQVVTAALGNAREFVRVTTYASAADARRAVLRRDRDAAVVVPDGFPMDPITVVGAPNALAVEVLAGAVREIVTTDGALLGAADGADGVPLAVTSVAVDAPAEATAGVVDAWRDADAYRYFSVSMAVFFALIAAHSGLTEYTGGSRSGVAARTRAFGVGRATIALGATLATTAYVAIVLVALTLGTWALFGVAWGGALGWLALTIMGSLAFVAVVLLVLAAVPQPAAFESIGMVVIMAMAMLGGSLTPLNVLPEELSSRFTWLPNRALLDGYFVLGGGGGWSDLGSPLARMALAAVIAFALAAIVSKARAAREDR